MDDNTTTHDLKTDRPVFEQSWLNLKPFEIRFDDRGFQVGDELVLHETRYTGTEMYSSHEDMICGKPLEYTGRRIRQEVLSILRDDQYGLKKGWCILGVKELHRIGTTDDHQYQGCPV